MLLAKCLATALSWYSLVYESIVPTKVTQVVRKASAMQIKVHWVFFGVSFLSLLSTMSILSLLMFSLLCCK